MTRESADGRARHSGFTSAAEGYEGQPLNLHDWIVKHPAATFFYRVRGNELHAEGMREGAVLVVDRSITPERGKFVLLEEEGSFVVRRYLPGKSSCQRRNSEAASVCGVVIAAVIKM